MLTFRARVDLWAVQCRDTLHSPKLRDFWNLSIRLLSVISRTLVRGFLPLSRDAVGVFYSPSQLGKPKWFHKLVFNKTVEEKVKRELHKYAVYSSGQTHRIRTLQNSRSYSQSSLMSKSTQYIQEIMGTTAELMMNSEAMFFYGYYTWKHSYWPYNKYYLDPKCRVEALARTIIMVTLISIFSHTLSPPFVYIYIYIMNNYIFSYGGFVPIFT